jgi:hypothetical protein
MGGGLMQLVAYGAQDVYLTGNPQITFFKVVYRRHTNFSMEAIQQTIDGTVGTGASTVSATVSRNGDLVGKMWLDVRLTAPTGVVPAGGYADYCLNTGHAFVNQVEVEIGGQMIDRHDGHYLDAYNELTDHLQDEAIGLNKGASGRESAGGNNRTISTVPLQLYVPLKFWFNKNPGLALPLIALQYHEVKVKLTTRPVNSLINSNVVTNLVATTTAPTVTLWADYIYLDTDERRRFAQVSHEYLIEQVQTETFAMGTSVTLNLNHPVKELIWGVQQNTVFAVAGTNFTGVDRKNGRNVAGGAANTGIVNGGQFQDYFNYLTQTGGATEVIGNVVSRESFGTAKLVLNGQDRFAARNASYFRTCQPCQAGHKVPSKHLYCYSFALKPEEHQPSGTCNFSRIDNAQLQFTNPSGAAHTLRVWAINYNVLRIMSGMGGLAYSN